MFGSNALRGRRRQWFVGSKTRIQCQQQGFKIYLDGKSTPTWNPVNPNWRASSRCNNVIKTYGGNMNDQCSSVAPQHRITLRPLDQTKRNVCGFREKAHHALKLRCCRSNLVVYNLFPPKDIHLFFRPHSSQQIRWTATDPEQQERKQGVRVDDTDSFESTKRLLAKHLTARKTDTEFTKYLTGEQIPLGSTSSTDDKEDVDNKNNPNHARLLLLSKRQSRSNVVISGIDNDKAMYEQILQVSYKQKEEAHIRTAANVNRALLGNVVICAAKFGAWVSSGSSAMLAEFIHSVVDCGNQSLLLIGLRDARMAPDKKHQYGYGKSIYFWALVSALGTFFLGAGVSMTHAVGELMAPSLHVISWEVWTVLALSFTVDGYVLVQTIRETYETKPKGVSYFKHLSNIRDPATLAVLLEDGAACIGILLAMGGIGLSHATGNAIFDGMAGVAISTLLGAMGLVLVRVNHRFLLGQSVDKEIVDDIGAILLSRRSIDGVRSVQSQWTGPESFSYKAEVDFDGTFLAAKLMPIYQHEFMQIQDSMDEELQVLLALYAEDVMRTVEREVRHVESQIRKKYPGAEYIELEPMSVDADRLAIDDNLEAELKRVESDALNRYLKSLRTEASENEMYTALDQKNKDKAM